ncbi:ATP-binding protein [Achromobacter sp. GG226]|uniref:ATP-binding protein n=1 Tax=Verticiella alkaliphila TaxID=2779529 RepID=UPI001C0D8F8F|nr:ATP-binding protein [Verticiella sp. GG226]MBU4610873.1 ATP-binding protein [Verticiella sp. GG226]
MTPVSSIDPESSRLAEVIDPSGVAAARRAAADLAVRGGLGETDVGRISLLVTEAATNLLKHAGQGEILLRALPGTPASLEILVIDRGPGLAPERLLSDGFSSAGTLGAGLGAMRRQSSAFDMYSRPGQGTVIRMVVHAAGTAEPAPGRFVYGVVGVPLAGERVSGDAWVVQQDAAGHVLMSVADGLGHGYLANDASLAAIGQVHRADEAPGAVLARMHERLRSTRGAAVAVAAIDAPRGTLLYAGIGNIAGSLTGEGKARSLLSHNGIVGHNARRFLENSHACHGGDVIILASDGLGQHWSLNDYPGLREHHPSVIAAVLYRDHSRRRDDLAVLVGRLPLQASFA